MATLVADAIEIITDTGLGVPVSYNDTTIGLASDGHFYLITGRPTISVVTGDTTRTAWYTGILTDERSGINISRGCNFIQAGAMEEVSGLSFGIKNTGAFFSTLRSQNVYLTRRKVKYYRATSSNGTTWNFELRWSGVIDDQPFNELTYLVQCVSVAKDIFRLLPKVAMNTSTFEDAPEDSRDKMVPIAIGRVANSPLVNTKGSGEKTTLTQVSGVDYTMCASFGTTGPTATAISLLTGPDSTNQGPQFTANDSRLVGKYLSVVVGDAQRVLITGNSATYESGAQWITDLTYAEPLTGTVVSYGAGLPDPGDPAIWWFEVVDFEPVLIASTKPISEFESAASGSPQIQKFTSDAKAYTDISELNASSDTSNIEATGYPGLSILANTADDSGDLFHYSPIQPTEITVISRGSWTSSDIPAVGASAPLLFDRDDSAGNYYTLTKTIPALGEADDLIFEVSLPSERSLKTFEALYLLPDFSHNMSTSPRTVQITATIWGKDIYGRLTQPIVNSYQIKNSSLSVAGEGIYRLPGAYVDEDRSDAAFYVDKANFDISELISDTKQAYAWNVLRIQLHFVIPFGSDTYNLKMKEIGFIGKIAVNVTSETIYSALKGETHGTTWDGRKTASDPILTLVPAIEHGIRNYDTEAEVWQAGHAYTAGEMVRGTADTGHIFVCTTSGTSHASTEPTWTDTAGATYSDGTCAWKEYAEIPVDKTTFDAAATQRADWLIGRTLTESKKSDEYYKDMLAQGFLIGLFDSAGRFKVKAWRDNTTSLQTFNSANIIQGTLSDIRLSPMAQMYNDLLIPYDWSPGAGKFNKQIQVTKVDRPAFPLESDYVTGPNTTVTNLGSFVATGDTSGLGITSISIASSAAHGLLSGDYVSLSGNTDGYSFDVRLPISIDDTTHFTVFDFGAFFTAATSSSGTLRKHSNKRLKWKDYVAGVDTYAMAKILWDQCHASYLVSKTINKLPSDLGDCYWYFDPYATDPNGDRLWPDLSTGDNHAAYYYALNLVNWTAWQKQQVTFETIDNATYSALEIGDPVTFNDAKLTAGGDITGWISRKDQIGASGKNPGRFRFELTLLPTGYADHLIIEEHGASDIIDEHGATNIYEEHGA